MRLSRKLLSLLLLFILPMTVSAQEIDTMTVNGEEMFVYPFPVESDQSHHYWAVSERKYQNPSREDYTYEDYLESVKSRRSMPDSMICTPEEFQILKKMIASKSYKKVQKLHMYKFGEMPTKEEFKHYLKRKRKRKNKYFEEDEKFLNTKKFKKAVRSNPYPLLIQTFRMNNDIIPILDPIPDGKYVQLYDEHCIVDKKGACDPIYDRIAGYFSIKNNLLHGEATWVDLQGDTLKHGWFDNGMKVGEWKNVILDMAYLSEDQADLYVERGYPDIDTIIRIAEYKDGSRNGLFKEYQMSDYPIMEGHYKDDEEVGQWSFNEVQFKVDPNAEKKKSPDYDEYGDEIYYDNLIPIRNNHQLTKRYTLNSDESLIVKPVLIRSGLHRSWDFGADAINLMSEYPLVDLPYRLYTAAFEKEEDLDLEEEESARDYSYENDYYNYESESYYGYNTETVYDASQKKQIKRGVFYDSIGAYPQYLDTYEAYYPNGQIAYKYEFDNGKLIAEPNVYWDNGKIHDEINFVVDSNHYMRNVYDYDGKVYESIVYDSLGDYLRTVTEEEEDVYITIDGTQVIDNPWGDYWYKNVSDTIYTDSLTEMQLSYRSWSKIDTAIVWDGFFDPVNRIRTGSVYNVQGGLVSKYDGQFSEMFDSWTGKSFDYLGDLELETINSASFSEWRTKDSLYRRHAQHMFNYFKITSDYTLKRNGEMYTGGLLLDFTGKKLEMNKGLEISIPLRNVDASRLSKDVSKYLDKGKVKNELELSQLNSFANSEAVAGDVYKNMFQPLLKDFFSVDTYNDDYDMEYYDYYEEEKPPKIKKNEKPAKTEIIKGNILDGKPTGKWASYDQYGEERVSVTFNKGEAEGEVRFYDYQKPYNDNDYYYEDEYGMDLDSFPEKHTRYLSKVQNYKNGELHGKEYTYNWFGSIITEKEFKDGYEDGVSIERSGVATSVVEYQNGMLNGYMRTYLTLPGKDSLLLYDLLFQNGMLQGESKSYHSNGTISKRGFFLSGEPIDDYEGYDTLGFKYHYVKFQYAYPIEEKIWEENALSVRYKFNWEDSIEFVPIDITDSESIKRMLANAGYAGNYLYQPYYGRPSLVDKSDVEYQLTKYFPNDTIARNGFMTDGRKSGFWDYYSYEGERLYKVNYFDSIIEENDSIRFKSKGIYTELNAAGDTLYESYIIEKFERYDCSHSDHYETRQLRTIWESNDTLHRMNGSVSNYYDNGTIQSAGTMKDGLPSGEWRFYDPAGKLTKYGIYTSGKRNGRWLSGDLSKTKYLGDICLNPNMPDLEEEMRYRGNFLDIVITNYKMGKSLNKQYYDVNMNEFIDYDEEGAEAPDGESTDDLDDNSDGEPTDDLDND